MSGLDATTAFSAPASTAGVVVASGAPPHGQRHALAIHRSRKRIAPFRLHVPASTPAAVALLYERPGAWVLAGGIDVVNRMKAGAEPEDVVYVGRIDALRRIEQSQGLLHVGATCTHHELATSPTAARALAALPAVWGAIANPRIRFKGTVGGNLMAGEPDYEGPAILAALDAELRFLTPDGIRTTPCAEYFGSARRDPTWLLEAVAVPCGRTIRLDYDRSLKGVAGVVLALTVDGALVVGARAAVTWAYRAPCCADLPLGAPLPLAALSGDAGTLARAWAAAIPEPITNHLASGGYRRRIIEVHLRRALARAARGAAS
jgi:carbon-monoxide dehydrogenase medium subunit